MDEVSELANLYGVEIRIQNQAVKRNADCFPEDFIFRLSPEEWDQLKSGFTESTQKDDLRSQSVTLEKGRDIYLQYLLLCNAEILVFLSM